ncbi:hypothetical protein [Nocardia arthritidis]|uniref:hypothetical protein n=1 Tax=Nocardia arthritidis TaxID=228602 RepID=UPI0012ECC7F9|nr:hypothetical protein [Nocardia arthritidis]
MATPHIADPIPAMRHRVIGFESTQRTRMAKGLLETRIPAVEPENSKFYRP